MRIVNPDVPVNTATPSATTGRLRLFRPTTSDLVDAALLLALILVALTAFHTTFTSGRYLIVGAVGTLLGIAAAHAANVLRWHWLTVPALTAALYLLLGGALTIPSTTIAGFIPTPATITRLLALAISGWKGMLTTLAPVDGDGPYLALVLVIGLVGGAAGFTLARRTRLAWPPVALALGLVAFVIALGTFDAAVPWLTGGAAGVLALGWLVVRHARQGRLAGTGSATLTRWASAAALVAVALTGGLLLGDRVPGANPTRMVLRAAVQPPIEIDRYPSPLSGFRKYATASQPLFTEPLLKVEGVNPGTPIRFAVLDDYVGTSWSAAGAVRGDANSGFQRIGSRVPGSPAGQRSTLRLTVQPGYAATSDLNVWLPGIGSATEVSFRGAHAEDHAANFRYNLGTGQGLVPDRLKAGDVIELTAVGIGADAGQLPKPAGQVIVADAASTFVAPAVASWGAKSSDPWSQLMAIGTTMRDSGFWSNGTGPNEGQYLPGHGQRRLTNFLSDVVGSDEHYAATYALLANRLGYPTRVILGANVPTDGMIKGSDVKAWVEVSLAGRGWVAIPTESFSPNRDKSPTSIPPLNVDQDSTVIVPPPNPSRPPGSFDALFNVGASGDAIDRPKPNELLLLLVLIARWVGPPLALIAAVVGAILGAKALRRRRRRTARDAGVQVGGAWLEFVDRARDLGRRVPARGTRLEQARAIGTPDAVTLAASANRLVFGAGTPTPQDAGAYWTQVLADRKNLTKGLSPWRRLVAALNPRSLVPLARDRHALEVDR